MLVDGHGHLHPAHDPWVAVEAAGRSFARAARELGLPETTPGCLLLVDPRGADSLARLRSAPPPPGVELVRTREDGSSLVARGSDPLLALVRGHQIVTGEGLEVLAPAADLDLPDGLPLGEVLSAVRAGGAIPVLPWGVGKWWFRRGRIVSRALAEAEPGSLFLGDNGGRLGPAPFPPLLRRAQRSGIPVLPGSDPLPVPGEERRLGGYGFLLPGDLDPVRPAASISRLLGELRAPVVTFGRPAGVLDFCRMQLSLRVMKVRRGPRGPLHGSPLTAERGVNS